MVISYSWFRTVFIHDRFEEIDHFIDYSEPWDAWDYELSHKTHPFISIPQCKSLWLFPGKERRQITDVSFILKKTEILMIQKLEKSPRSIEDNLLMLLGTLQMQWHRPVCFYQ